MLFEVRDLTVHYGAIRALNNVNVSAEEGEILSIIGANGAGKSTLLRSLTGIVKPSAGRIVFDGTDLTGLKTNEIVKRGVTMVPEGRKIFPELTVKENLEVGAYTLANKKLRKELFDLVMTTFPRLEERFKQHGGTLSGGEQQMLSIGRALMSHPRILLLDEPSMGLSPIATREIFALIRLINQERRITMLLVEQNAHMALEHSSRTYVLENGSVTMEGKSSELKGDVRVVEAYLGV